MHSDEITSPHAIRILSLVAGIRNSKYPALSPRAAVTASLIAKNTLQPRKNGGSPTALLLWTAKGLSAFSRRDTLNLSGTSLKLWCGKSDGNK